MSNTVRRERRTCLIVGALLLSGSLSRGQAPVPIPKAPSGLRFHGLTSYVGYSSIALPERGAFFWRGLRLGGDVHFGGSATVGLARPGKAGSVSLIYTSSYTGRASYSEWNSLNHHLSFWASRKLGAKWDFSLSASGGSTNLEQFLFTPTVFQRVLDAPISFEDLASAMVNGRFTNDQLASILTGAAIIDSPAQTLIFGNRIASGSTQAALSYRPTPKLSASMAAGGSRNYRLPGDPATDALSSSYFLSDSTRIHGSAGLSYSLTPRTQIGLGAAVSRTLSPFYDAYGMTATGSIARKMGRQWFLRGRAGAGRMSYLRETAPASRRPKYVTGGGLGVTTFSHTFLAGYDRTVGDTFGLGAGTSSSVSGSWQWARPGRSWTPFASAGYHRLEGGSVRGVKGFAGNVGLSKSLSRHTGLSTGYSYLWNTGRYFEAARSFSVHSVRLTFVWSPGPEGF